MQDREKFIEEECRRISNLGRVNIILDIVVLISTRHETNGTYLNYQGKSI